MKNQFGKELRRARRLADLTLKQRADAGGISVAQVSGIEHGDRNPPSEKIIAKWLGMAGCAERLEEFTDLARKAMKRITVEAARGRDPEETSLVFALARQYEEDGFTEEQLDQLRKIVGKRKPGGKA